MQSRHTVRLKWTSGSRQFVSQWTGDFSSATLDEYALTLKRELGNPKGWIEVIQEDGEYSIPVNNIAYLKEERRGTEPEPSAQQSNEWEGSEADGGSAEATGDAEGAGADRPAPGGDGGPPAGQRRGY